MANHFLTLTLNLTLTLTLTLIGLTTGVHFSPRLPFPKLMISWPNIRALTTSERMCWKVIPKSWSFSRGGFPQHLPLLACLPLQIAFASVCLAQGKHRPNYGGCHHGRRRTWPEANWRHHCKSSQGEKAVLEIICAAVLTCSFDRMERLKTLENRLPLPKSDGLLPQKRHPKQRKQRLYWKLFRYNDGSRCLPRTVPVTVCFQTLSFQGNQRARASNSEVSTHRKREFDDMVTLMENKYQPKSAKKSKAVRKQKSEAPSEEDFLATQKRMMEAKQAKGKWMDRNAYRS